jgi:hypothetical protein
MFLIILKSMKKLVYLSLIAILAIACKPSGGDTEVKSITVSPVTLKVPTNSSMKIKATTDPANAKVTWKSSDNTIASVSSDGTVSGLAVGTVTITATAGDKSATCNVTVINEYEAFNSLVYSSTALDDSLNLITWYIPCGNLVYNDGFTGAGYLYYIPSLVKKKGTTLYCIGDYNVYDGLIDATNCLTVPLLSFEKGFLNTENNAVGSLLLYVDMDVDEEGVAALITGQSFTLGLMEGGSTIADLYLPAYRFVLDDVQGNEVIVTNSGSAPANLPIRQLNGVAAQSIRNQLNAVSNNNFVKVAK